VKLTVIILAAGQGKRMHSDLPKVLHPLASKPLLTYVIETALSLEPSQVFVVHGHQGEQLKRSMTAYSSIQWIEQSQQLGTGHAVAQAMPQISDDNAVLVLYGDVPLIQADTLRYLCQSIQADKFGILTVNLANPYGYGRIIRNTANQVQRIVEEKEATAAERQLQEVNTGIVIVPAKSLRTWLAQLDNNNAQGEYYLTDTVALAVRDQATLYTTMPNDTYEVMGVNDRVQLAELERYYQKKQAENLMRQGVSVSDPNRLDIRGQVTTGRDVTIDINVVLTGRVQLGNRVKIAANCVITNAIIGDDSEIFPYSLLENVTVGAHCRIGPFARLRPETVLADQVHIGNFVEIKKSTIATESKINHLSYIGDSEVGCSVNIGAGTITCNYDGAHKHKTIIGDHAFIGSDTQLVAPVKIGKGSTIGAGSTITKDTAENALALTRVPQKTIPNWKRPVKVKK